MANEIEGRTQERLLLIGCNSFSGINSVEWGSALEENILDYDIVVASVPHITDEFLIDAKDDFLKKIRERLVRFLDSHGKLVVLLQSEKTIKRANNSPKSVTNLDWCPINIHIVTDSGKSISIKRDGMYEEYLRKMSYWTYFIKIPRTSLSNELVQFYGPKAKYEIPKCPYLENRYGRMLAGECCIFVLNKKTTHTAYGIPYDSFNEQPDFITGPIVFLPLIEGTTKEEALLEILKEEIGYSLKSPAPDWAEKVEMPGVATLCEQVNEAEKNIENENERIKKLSARIGDLNAYRRLLYATGNELEDVVRKSLELCGGEVKPAGYGEEEYILEVDGEEYLIEVKGVAKSISMKHLRQLNDYLAKYEEDTDKEPKGILVGNAWRNEEPELRDAHDTPVFPANVIKRGAKWEISLLSSLTLFDAVCGVLKNQYEGPEILKKIITASGVVKI